MADKEIQSWLWVVVMVVISIFGSITKNRKKREAEQTPPINEDEEEYNSDRESEMGSETDFWPEYKTEPAPFLKVELENVQSVSPVVSVQSATPLTDSPEETDAIDLSDPDELRKAVIYSEIMNRKY